MNRKLVSVPILFSICLQLFAFSVFAEPSVSVRPANRRSQNMGWLHRSIHLPSADRRGCFEEGRKRR
jgi:hypothetical protein